jgi:hypothetical protein
MARAVVAGQVVRESDIRGVLVKRPWIIEQELTHISRPDREYVAAEMNAFLVAWLTSLQCRVLNRPSGTSLSGPNWRPAQWAVAAARTGIRGEPVTWRAPSPRRRTSHVASEAGAPPIEVTVVGDRSFGAPDARYATVARRLASVAGVELLGVRFDARERAPHFLSATAMPSLRHAHVADAVCDYLLATPVMQ